MDDPELESRAHLHALRGLARVNRVSGTAGRIWSALGSGAGPNTWESSPIRMLDVACGGGDVAVTVAARARRAGVALEVHCCDRSPRALDRARARGEAAGIGLHLHELDVLLDPLPGGFDLVTSTLFLHHLERSDAVELLRRMAGAGRRLLIQDLRRTLLGWQMAWWGVRLLSTSRVVHLDGPRSVEAAFTLAEARELVAEAGLAQVRVEAVWPQRFVLHGSVS